MKIATWNVNRCRARSSRGSNLVARMADANADADVWVLTESFRDFAPTDQHRLVAWSADAPDRQAESGECWVVIWSRLPAEPVPLTADLERAAAVRLSEHGIVVVGTVLPWLGDQRQHPLRGSEAFRARLSEQAADWERLRAATGGRICVAGDFNQDLLPAGHYYHSATSRAALRETLDRCRLMCLTGGSTDPLTSEVGLASIDHICIGEGLRAISRPVSACVPPVGKLTPALSDHYAVRTEVSVA
jgi:endonuclease/exonuclease/phosphatase family metal-dependent hydrolase